jgi:hypothetical protein
VPSMAAIDLRNRHLGGLKLPWTLQTMGVSEIPPFDPQKPTARVANKHPLLTLSDASS